MLLSPSIPSIYDTITNMLMGLLDIDKDEWRKEIDPDHKMIILSASSADVTL